jgi:hypothetical protein
MPVYETVGVKFNMNKEEEKALFYKLNPNNKAGSIKKVLKEHYLLEDVNLIKNLEIKSLVEEIVINQYHEVNRGNIIELDKDDSINQNRIKINVGGRESII